MKLNKKGVILIYVLILINVALIMALVVFNNTNILVDNSDYLTIEKILYKNIQSNGQNFIKNQLKLNKDGSGYLDVISCPNAVAMSGSTNSATIATYLTLSGTVYFCNGTYLSNQLDIFFNTGATGFIASTYNGNSIGLTTNVSGYLGTSSFPDVDFTSLSFPYGSFQFGDSIDDNWDSDNYRYTSVGLTMYPSGYVDNDDLGRKQIFGNISSFGNYENIFWNNFETNAYITANTNNTGTYNQNISLVASGSLFLNVDKDFALKIVRFDRSRYTKFNRELIPLETLYSSGTLLSSSGYIQKVGGKLSLTGTVNANTKFFNFRDEDYAIFISNNTPSSILYYNLEGNAPTFTGVYINPLNDSFADRIKFLGNNILTNSGNLYIGKQFEIFGLK